jgi:hypothetical protein
MGDQLGGPFLGKPLLHFSKRQEVVAWAPRLV